MLYVLEAFVDALLNKHKCDDGKDRNQQLHQVCVHDISTNVAHKIEEFQLRTT